ncbi:MAG TPA: ribbon-helix-helix protein, CopG family [Mycobacteriales bacterium]|nr:ribbon-helix-helix protein, CopG family [Mycobacteriales bacterium]
MPMTLRLTAEETEALRAFAAREGRSMHDVARTAIRVYVDRRRITRAEALLRIVSEDRELLDRLAQ